MGRSPKCIKFQHSRCTVFKVGIFQIKTIGAPLGEWVPGTLSGRGKVKQQGPVVQSILSLTSSLVVKLLNDLISTIPYSQVFLLKKCE